MADAPVKLKYKSVGTIRYEYEGEEPSAESVKKSSGNPDVGPRVNWFFIPDANYCVEHYGKKYAIFVDQNDNTISRNLSESESGVEVKLEDTIFAEQVGTSTGRQLAGVLGAQSAAMSQSKVMVTVEENGDDLSLIGVSPPPPK